LRAYLEAAAGACHTRSTGGHFRLAIDRCFTLSGVGTVVTGTAHSGKVGAGETAIISPPGLKARVRSLHVQDRPAPSGQAGKRCALALVGDFEKKDIERGMWLVDPALAVPLRRFHGELRVPAGQPSLKHLQNVHVHLGASDILGRVALLDCAEVGAGAHGDSALVEILLERETLAVHGDRFVLRDAGAQRTVAGGRVLDIFPPLRHKRSAERLALLDAMRVDDPAHVLSLLAAKAIAGIDLGRFVINWNLDDAQAERLWQRSNLRVIRAGETCTGFAATAWTALAHTLLDALAREHECAPDMIGVERERLRRMTSGILPRPAFDALVNELLNAGRVAQTRAWLHLPAHRASVSADDRDLFATLKSLLDASPYNPPRVRDVFKASGIPEDTVRQLFRRIARAGELYPVAHDHYFTAGAVSELADIVSELCREHGAARAAALRDRIGGGRKVTIHILEFFDRIGYTRRVRDDHIVRREGVAHDWTT
jgi:selenocysteine-specific elongation factor